MLWQVLDIKGLETPRTRQVLDILIRPGENGKIIFGHWRDVPWTDPV